MQFSRRMISASAIRQVNEKRKRVVDEMLLQNGAPANKSARAAKRFPAGMPSGGKILHISMLRRNSPAGRAMHSGGMRFIHNNTGAVTVRQREKFGDRSDITIHAKHAFGDNQFPAAFLRVVSQSRFERVQIEMRINAFSRAGEPDAVNETRMIQGIRINQILFLQKRSYQAEIRRIAASKIKRCLGSCKSRTLFFNLIPDRRMPPEQSHPLS